MFSARSDEVPVRGEAGRGTDVEDEIAVCDDVCPSKGRILHGPKRDELWWRMSGREQSSDTTTVTRTSSTISGCAS